MDNEMIQRVAIAICIANGIDPNHIGEISNDDGYPVPGHAFPQSVTHRKQARAAIEAMLEPTKGMIEATICESEAIYANERREDHAHIWRTMIDAILATVPK